LSSDCLQIYCLYLWLQVYGILGLIQSLFLLIRQRVIQKLREFYDFMDGWPSVLFKSNLFYALYDGTVIALLCWLILGTIWWSNFVTQWTESSDFETSNHCHLSDWDRNIFYYITSILFGIWTLILVLTLRAMIAKCLIGASWFRIFSWTRFIWVPRFFFKTKIFPTTTTPGDDDFQVRVPFDTFAFDQVVILEELI